MKLEKSGLNSVRKLKRIYTLRKVTNLYTEILVKEDMGVRFDCLLLLYFIPVCNY
jgi:hypothetical protein